MKFPGPEMDGAPKLSQEVYPTGLSIYNDYPGPEEKPGESGGLFGGRGDGFHWPVAIGGNAYFHRAIPWNREKGAERTDAMGITFQAEGDAVELCYEDTAILKQGYREIITSDVLGINVTAETKWTDPDNKGYVFDRDMLGNPRTKNPTAGPLELSALKDGEFGSLTDGYNYRLSTV